jgi:hypothetical protein
MGTFLLLDPTHQTLFCIIDPYFLLLFYLMLAY